jgi:predicted  nucleic acid-binding Zn-ribbon protein
VREIEDKRAELRAELVNLQALINGRTQELADLKRKLLRLDERIVEAELRAFSRRDRGLNELVRMCNTPCWRFVPANVDVCEVRNG